MSTGWQVKSLGEVVTLQRGFDLPKQDRQPGSVPIVSSAGVSGAHNEARVKAPGVVTGRYGSIGQVHFVESDFWPLNTTLFVKDFKGNHPRFVAYLLQTIDFASCSDKSSVPGVNRNDLHRLRVEVPDLPEQRYIAETLGALDDKIELNRRMNHTLESMARAIFKSWFVDFDPVRNKMEGGSVGLPPDLAALFPDQMDGPARVPVGWLRGSLRDLVETMLGGDWGSSELTEECNAQVNCVRGADIPPLQDGGVGNPPVRFIKPRSLERRQLQNGDIVVEVSGGSPTQSTGRSALVTDGVLSRLAGPSVCSNFCRVVRFSDPLVSRYVYFWLRWIYDAGLLFDFENGTTGIKNLAIADVALEPVLPVPPAEVLRAFNRQVESYLRLRESLSQESDSLSRARDELLPWLLAGGLTNTEVTQ